MKAGQFPGERARPMQHSSIITLAAFDYAAANRLGLLLCRIGTERGLPIGIEIMQGGTQVFLALLPGATADNAGWLRRKRGVAQRFQQSSLSMRLECAAKGVDFNQRYGLDRADYIASGGAIPIAVAGAGMVGCVTVSGLPDTEDDALIRAALADFV